MLLPGIYNQLLLPAALAVQKALGNSPANAMFVQAATTKNPPRPFLVMNRVGAPPAASTLDGISDLVDGEIQFDAYADTPQQAETLSHSVRDYCMKTFVSGALPDGTTIQFVDVTADHDEPFEEGGTGYLYRALLRLHAFYTEAS